MDRRLFLKGLVATAAGVLVPKSVAAEPERRVWALDQTMTKAPVQWSDEPYRVPWDAAHDEMVLYSVRITHPDGSVQRFNLKPDGTGQYVAQIPRVLQPGQAYQYSVSVM